MLASGAVFGMAAQAALHHLGLDFGTIHGDLIADHAAKPRSAVSWWAWWLMALAAFLVGPSSAVLTRTIVANWWRMRALRLCATAAVVLCLAAVGALRQAPSTFAFTTNAALALLVMTASMLLAVLGAHWLGGLSPQVAPVRMPARHRAFAPLPAAHPWRGGGSITPGLPFLRFRERHALAPGPFSFGRLALVAVPALVVFAVVSALGSATVLLDSVAPGAIRRLVASNFPPAGAAGQARTLVLALLPTEPRSGVVMPPVAMLDAPPPPPLAPREPRQRAITVAVARSPALSESELTFTKGYTRRRAAQLAASMTSPPSIPQLTAAINIKRIRAASLRFTQELRVNRTVADNRYVADNRRFADKRQRATRRAREQNRYAEYNGYNSYGGYNSYNGYNGSSYNGSSYNGSSYNGSNRYSRHDRRHRGRERYGDNRFARAEQPYRRF